LTVPKPTRNRRAASKGKAARSKGEKKAVAKGGAGGGPRPATASALPECEDEAAFTETLIATGDAARLDKDGKLPAGATHKIVENNAGNVKTVRRRFSIA
jgi:hypothetical protein